VPSVVSSIQPFWSMRTNKKIGIADKGQDIIISKIEIRCP